MNYFIKIPLSHMVYENVEKYDNIDEWFRENRVKNNLKGWWIQSTNGIHFECKDDAILFALTWV